MKKSLLAAAILAFAAAPAFADAQSYTLTIKDHVFTPDKIEIPADTQVKLIVKNEDNKPEEFESHDLKREKVIAAGSQVTILVGPLKAGEYKFVGEYHEDTAKGSIIVK